MPVVAHHTDVQLIAGGPLATLFAGGPSVANPTIRLPPEYKYINVSKNYPDYRGAIMSNILQNDEWRALNPNEN